MLQTLEKYYQRHSLQLSVAAFSIFATLTIQVKYWVYYGHDCLQLNPYQIVSQKDSAHNDKRDEHCHSKASVEQAHEKHDHNTCEICQSFQQLTSAIYETYSYDFDSIFTPRHIIKIQYIDLISQVDLGCEASPRAPPFMLVHV